ncbi:hypothetical protein FE840_001210 [Peteryoungia desertarenae]|uniref:Uncharacterized protein n=1 Tax=Peteryoungia desertarenae TaxID=1813451 RepID=A0ABX6QJ25_9HYPH|nr:hypothetical protein [Peteryoungia desertarenae]QLF68282.1 hypothetical protein FE840_001210 [Peteryoungia desertarenae]
MDQSSLWQKLKIELETLKKQAHFWHLTSTEILVGRTDDGFCCGQICALVPKTDRLDEP